MRVLMPRRCSAWRRLATSCPLSACLFCGRRRGRPRRWRMGGIASTSLDLDGGTNLECGLGHRIIHATTRTLPKPCGHVSSRSFPDEVRRSRALAAYRGGFGGRGGGQATEPLGSQRRQNKRPDILGNPSRLPRPFGLHVATSRTNRPKRVHRPAQRVVGHVGCRHSVPGRPCHRRGHGAIDLAGSRVRRPRGLLGGTDRRLALRPCPRDLDRAPRPVVVGLGFEQAEDMLGTVGSPRRQHAMLVDVEEAASVTSHEPSVSHFGVTVGPISSSAASSR